ncbi:hypothetical protein QBC44DRAFT_371511 [Cladorrhinum sp. PSN332]|nr:hypothetical protein QBC44DRAFT_371511 [Cladorrhinum sp. PSN332]
MFDEISLDMTVFDSQGDLTLRVGSHLDGPGDITEDLRVCSAALRRSSPVFQIMLFGPGPWIERKPAGDEPWIVQLPEDDPKPFKVIMAILHGAFAFVRKAIFAGSNTLCRDLHDILVLADKYFWIKTLSPWSKEWLNILEEEPPTRGLSAFKFNDVEPNTDGLALITHLAWHYGHLEFLISALKIWICFAHLQVDPPAELVFTRGPNNVKNLGNTLYFLPSEKQEINARTDFKTPFCLKWTQSDNTSVMAEARACDRRLSLRVEIKLRYKIETPAIDGDKIPLPDESICYLAWGFEKFFTDLVELDHHHQDCKLRYGLKLNPEDSACELFKDATEDLKDAFPVGAKERMMKRRLELGLEDESREWGRADS